MNFFKIGMLAFFLVLVQSTSYAEPSKKETADFILKKADNISISVEGCKDKIGSKQEISFNDDYSILYIKHIDYYGNLFARSDCEKRHVSSITYSTVKLIDIDPDTTEISLNSLVIRTKENKGLIECYEEYFNNNDRNIKPGISNESCTAAEDNGKLAHEILSTYYSSVNLNKLYRAMKHLVILNGGAGELF